MAKSKKPEDDKQRKTLPKARPYLGGGGGMMPSGEGPRVVGTDAGIAQVQGHPDEMPGESPDWERSPSRGGWQF
ncbi:MAG: hypothetical protein ACK46X_10695 [Candidatus Sericytochromatia bacterium]